MVYGVTYLLPEIHPRRNPAVTPQLLQRLPMVKLKFNYTKAALDALPVPGSGKRATYSDAKTTGLQIRVTANGVKTFSVFRRIKGGQPERVTLGRYPDMSIEQARTKAALINAAIEGGANPAEAKRAHKAELTFADLFEEYLVRHAKPTKLTWANDKQRYDQYVERPLGKIKLSKLTKARISEVHSRISRDGHPTVANRVLALISSVLGRGVEWGRLAENPAKGIRRNKERSRDNFIKSDEMPRFFKAVGEEQNTAVRDYILLALLTGARRANTLAMRWKDVSVKRMEWRIPVTKNGEPQTIPLMAEALQILKTRKDASEKEAVFVFPGSGKKGHLAEPRKGWLRILKRAKLSDLRIHDLRRTFGSWQVRTGASLAIIGKSLNHKHSQTTAIYARLDLDPVRLAMEAATSAMLEAGGLKEIAKVVAIK